MKFKVPYSIKKSLVRILPFATVAVMVASCHKEPYDVTIDWTWRNPPDRELIKKYADDRNVKTIVLNLLPCTSGGFSPRAFRRARDSLEINYFSISPHNTVGRGNIYVDEFNGAQLPDPYANNPCGMALEDSIWYANKGFTIVRGSPLTNKSK